MQTHSLTHLSPACRVPKLSEGSLCCEEQVAQPTVGRGGSSCWLRLGKPSLSSDPKICTPASPPPAQS